jgi:flagellar hook-associated protein 2
VIGTNGFAQAFEAKVAVYSQTGGLLDSRINAAQDEINRIKTSLERFDQRMETRQTFLERQFTALESALNKSQGLQSQIAARLGTSSS